MIASSSIPTLRQGPIGLRPIRLRDASAWRAVRARNRTWLTRWDATSPLGSVDVPPTFGAMVRTLRSEARGPEAVMKVPPGVVRVGVRYILPAALTIGGGGLGLIKYYEGEVREVYLDPVGIATVCVGHTGTVSTADIGRKYSEAVCESLLREDTGSAVRGVQQAVKVPVSQGQFDALVSLSFNIGNSAFRASTLVKHLNAGNCKAAAMQFSRWVNAKGRVLPGLVKRRAAERALFERDCNG